MNFSALTVQSILDYLGINISNPQLINYVYKESESFVIKFLSDLLVLTKTRHLTIDNVNKALRAKNWPQLYGYNSNEVQTINVTCDQMELIVEKEKKLDLNELANANCNKTKTNNNSMKFDYLLVEGVYTHKRLLSNRKILVKRIKGMEKTVSLQQLTSNNQSNLMINEINKNQSVSITEKVYNQNQIVGDVLCNDLQLYYIKIINLLRNDTLNSKLYAINCLTNDNGIQQLIPYFLQFIYGQMTLNYQDVGLMTILIEMTKALVLNKNLCTSYYMHSFLKIAFSGLNGFDYSGRIYEEDFSLRELSADLLSIICKKYEPIYSSIRIHVLNALIKTLFNPTTTLNAHYGALCGIESLGMKYVSHLLPHLVSYLIIIKPKHNKNVKAVEAIKRKIASLLEQKY